MLLVNTSEADKHDLFVAEVLEPLTTKVIRPIVRRHLRVSLRPEDTHFDNQNALELIGDIQASLLAALQPERNGNGLVNIEAYATTVTRNACSQYLREKFPVRTNQESALRYFLSHTDGLDVWQDEVKRWLCGRAEWRNDSAAPVPINGAASDVKVSGGTNREKYTAIVEAVFNTAAAPVLLDDMVDHVMVLLGIGERIEIGDSSDTFDDSGLNLIQSLDESVQSHLETVARLKVIWNTIRAMPAVNRKALLLNLKDTGGGLLAVLPLNGVADVSEIAEALKLSLEEFESIWETLPWSDLQIAEHLGMTRQQVINLRQSARARLIRLTGKP